MKSKVLEMEILNLKIWIVVSKKNRTLNLTTGAQNLSLSLKTTK